MKGSNWDKLPRRSFGAFDQLRIERPLVPNWKRPLVSFWFFSEVLVSMVFAGLVVEGSGQILNILVLVSLFFGFGFRQILSKRWLCFIWFWFPLVFGFKFGGILSRFLFVSWSCFFAFSFFGLGFLSFKRLYMWFLLQCTKTFRNAVRYPEIAANWGTAFLCLKIEGCQRKDLVLQEAQLVEAYLSMDGVPRCVI